MNFTDVLQKLRTLENPYPGLRPFDLDESHLFFGRDQQTAELVVRLEGHHFVAVVGVSGSGKSSLVRAGLIPALERAQLSEAGRRWRMVVSRPGGAPYEHLAADLAKCGLDGSPLKTSSHGLIEIARQLASDESLLVIVDQFEELFRYKELGLAGDDAKQRHDLLAADAAEFVQLLLEAARHQPPVYIVLTMRSDYLGDCAEFRDLPETLNDCQYLVPRLTREQRKAAILGPLGRVEMEPALVQRLLNVTGDEPDQLPVLQHALMRTWNRWYADDRDHRRRIELRDFEAIGGLDDALNRHADELVSGTPTDITATIFKRLTARGSSNRERRNPATLAELWAVCLADTPPGQGQVNAVVDRFRQGEATFLVPRTGPLAADAYIDITHESLIRQWKTLRDRWLPEEQASAKTFLYLLDRAESWADQKGDLLSGLGLNDALEWENARNKSTAWARHYASESALERVLAFIRASVEQRREELAKRRWLRVGIAGGVLAIIGLLGFAVFKSRRAEEVARHARTDSLILSMRSVRDPLTRALLLAEQNREDFVAEHLAVLQEAAATPIPLAMFQYQGEQRAVGAGFLSNARAGILLSNGALWSWPRDGRGRDTTRAPGAESSNAATKETSPLSLTIAAFSRDGQWVAAGSEHGGLWLARTDAVSGFWQIVAADAASETKIGALAFSRDGRQLAMGYATTAVVFQLDQGGGTDGKKPTRLAGGHNSSIASLDFDPTGARLVTGAVDGTLRIWDLEKPGRPAVALANSDIPLDPVTCVAFRPDGKWVLSGYDTGGARIQRSDGLDPDGALRLSGHTGTVTAASFNGDGSTVVTASDDYTAQVWAVQMNPASLKMKAVGSPSVLTHGAAVTAVAVDGTHIVTTSEDGTGRIWPIEQGEPRIVGRHGDVVESVNFSPDGTGVLTASHDQTATLWSVDRKAAIQVFKGDSTWVRSAIFSPVDASTLVIADDNGTVRVWDLRAPGQPRGSFAQEGGTVFDVAFSPRADRLVMGSRDNQARVWTTSGFQTGGVLEAPKAADILKFPHDDWVLSAAFSRDGTRLVTASQDGSVRIWGPNHEPLVPLQTIPGRGAIAYKAAFSPDGTRIVAAFSDKLARVWRRDSVEPALELRHRDAVLAAVFNAGGDRIATGSTDGTARLWDAQDGGERVVLHHGKDAVRAVAFNDTGTLVATGTDEGVVRVWNISIAGLHDYLKRATESMCLPPADHVRFLGESEAKAIGEYRACETRRNLPANDTSRAIAAREAPPR